MKVFKILRNFTKPVTCTRKSKNVFTAEFDVEDEEFYIRVDALTTPDQKIFATVIFGKYDELGLGDTKATNSKKPILVFNSVIGAVKDLLTKINVEIVVFAAKDADGHFDSRNRLYKRMAERFEKESSWNKFTQTKNSLGLYVLSKEPFSKEDFAFIRSQLDDQEGEVEHRKSFK